MGQGEGLGTGMGEGSGRGDLCPGLCWSILWFLGLIFLGWPIGFLIAWLYVLLLPFGACIDPLKEVNEAILKIVQLPLTFTENMLEQKACCSG